MKLATNTSKSHLNINCSLIFFHKLSIEWYNTTKEKKRKATVKTSNQLFPDAHVQLHRANTNTVIMLPAITLLLSL